MRCLLAAVLLALLIPPAAARASTPPAPCPDGGDYLCGVLTVPLDRSGLVPGTLDLRYEVQAKGPAPILLDLAGGPGQSEAEFAFLAAAPLQPLLGGHRLAVLDQRGTGATALRCATLQHEPVPRPATVAECAARLGPARAFYTTVDSVLDIEDLRVALGAPSLALSATSYGTYVAGQYARAFPARVERLLLNSPVGFDGVGAFYQERFGALPRMLRDQCARGACRGITPSPLADVATVARRLRAGHALRGTVYDATGRAHTLRLRRELEVAEIVLSADVNPDFQAVLPGALRAAAQGDGALLLRTLALASGGVAHVSQESADLLSQALNVTTICQDVALPYALDTPPAARPPLIQAALRSVPPASYAPFGSGPVLALSVARECERWPATPPRPRFGGPLPDVPALVLVGRQDLRTPLENTRSITAALPHATVLAAAGAGHDVLDTDTTDCVNHALTRWAAGQRVGNPCAGKRLGKRLAPAAPRPVPAVRARVLAAVRATLADAKRQLDLADAFFVPHEGGGLRGGSWTTSGFTRSSLALRDDEYAPGVRVSGRPHPDENGFKGTLRISGVMSGTLTIDRRGHLRGLLR